MCWDCARRRGEERTRRILASLCNTDSGGVSEEGGVSKLSGVGIGMGVEEEEPAGSLEGGEVDGGWEGEEVDGGADGIEKPEVSGEALGEARGEVGEGEAGGEVLSLEILSVLVRPILICDRIEGSKE
jgi:hypothetical protein